MEEKVIEEKVIGEADDIKDNKLMAILAYFGILVLVPILAAPNSKFARFHANQGVVLLIAAVVYMIGTSIIGGAIGILSYTISSVFVMILDLGNLVLFVLMIIGIINAYKGEYKELPYLGQFKILK